MNLPEGIKFRATCFNDGANGWRSQEFRNDAFGINCRSVKENKSSPFVQTFTVDSMPGKTFKSVQEVYAAFKEQP